MRVNSISYNNSIGTLPKVYSKQRNISFKAELWYDDNPDPNTIFALWMEQERNSILRDDTPISVFNSSIGSSVEDPRFQNLKINSIRYIGNNCYKGGMTDASNFVKELKENGIRRMIMLCNPFECDISSECKKNGMDWTHVYVPLNIQGEISKKDFDYNFVYARFLDILKELRTGNVFIGCESGNIRTKRFLHVVQMLDPGCKLDLKSDADRLDYVYAGWIYEGLSGNEKKALGYTKEFERLIQTTLNSRVNPVLKSALKLP